MSFNLEDYARIEVAVRFIHLISDIFSDEIEPDLIAKKRASFERKLLRQKHDALGLARLSEDISLDAEDYAKIEEMMAGVDLRGALRERAHDVISRFIKETPLFAFRPGIGIERLSHKYFQTLAPSPATEIFFPGTPSGSPINLRDGVIQAQKAMDVSRAAKTLLQHGYSFGEEADKSLSLLSRAEHLAMSLLPLEGALIMLELKNLPSKGDARRMLGIKEQKEVVDDTGPNIGRPSKRQEVLQAYERLFPNGRGPSTWKEVMRKIEDETGISADFKTLKRAISEMRPD